MGGRGWFRGWCCRIDDGIRITYKGKSFFFVASVADYNWCATGADSILLFYEPENRIALFTFDWT